MSIGKRIVGGIAGVGMLSLAVFGVVDMNMTETKTEMVDEPIKYTTNVVYDNTMREGTSEVEQEGKDGKKAVEYAVTYKYGKEVSRKKKTETVVEAVQNEKIVKGTKKYYMCSNGVEYETLADKNDCEKRVAWEEVKESSLQECYNDSSKFNCWFDEYPGTTIHWSYYTYNYTPSYYYGGSYYSGGNSNYRTGAICSDGWRSSATGRGACSHHGGVSTWLP